MTVILAIETTEQFGSIALADDRHGNEEPHVVEMVLPKNARSAQTLVPAIDTLFRANQVKPQEVSAVAVIVGPGSFTGLRVGVSTAKTLAYVVNAKMLTLTTHEVIALAFAKEKKPETRRLSVGVDAQRGDVVVQNFLCDNFHVKAENDARLISVAQWWEMIAKSSTELPKAVLAGPALERWHKQVPSGFFVADPFLWQPRASAMISAAFERLNKDQTDNLWQIQPIYSRMSAAEERQQP